MKWTKNLKTFVNKTIAVDFDGTIVKDCFPEIGEPNLELVIWLKKCQKEGCKLILWTCRSNTPGVGDGKILDSAVTFCKSLGLNFDSVNENLKEVQEKWNNDTRKVMVDYYLDVKSMLI